MVGYKVVAVDTRGRATSISPKTETDRYYYNIKDGKISVKN